MGELFGMISVFVCENDTGHLKTITECVKNLIAIDGQDLKLELAASEPSEILNFIKKSKKTGSLYFLDIELDRGQSGVDLARAIRKQDPAGTIAFITSHPGYRELSFKYSVEAVDYIQKGSPDEIRERIKSCINRACQKYEERHDGYVFTQSKDTEVFCKYADILFFETCASVSHRIILHTKRMQYVYYGALDKVFSELPRNIFFRSHRSCVVNLNNLTAVCKTELMQGKNFITMPNGAECKVSAGNRKMLLNFMEMTGV
jgi:two-component system response regulator AgrA